MLTELQQRRVWEEMFGSDTRAKYFADLSGKYLRNQQTGTWLTLALATSDFAALLTQLPPQNIWIRPALAAATAAVSLYLALAQFERKAIEAAALHGRLSRLSKAYESLWENVHAEDAFKTLQTLDDEVISAATAATSLRYDPKAMARWQHHTEREYQARYA